MVSMAPGCVHLHLILIYHHGAGTGLPPFSTASSGACRNRRRKYLNIVACHRKRKIEAVNKGLI